MWIKQISCTNQGLSEIDKKSPDVAIIDVKLDKGDNDGIQLLEHIKQNTDIPVIITSDMPLLRWQLTTKIVYLNLYKTIR